MHFRSFAVPTALAATLSLLHPCFAQGNEKMLRFSCGQLVTERLDPVYSPGVAPSQHLHQIVGGNAFNTTMTGNIGEEASCTTCTFSDDFSNYWTPVMMFRGRNGTFKRVPQLSNVGFNGVNGGGATVYYTYPEDTSVNVTAFAPGFRMMIGNSSARSQTGYGGFTNLYRCYTDGSFEPNPFGVSANDTYDFPTQYCPGGLRVNIFFQTCWDGRLDSPDHESHVSYSYGGGCPSSHPIQIPQVFLETVWDTGSFPKSEWPTDGSQPFVWSQGDGTGYGHHADYVFGWKGDSLQKAVDARCDIGCAELASQSQKAANQCTLKQVVEQDLSGWLDELPGNLTVTYK